jgi:hypothetical protein
MANNRNPLGIEENDLPLYFGDATGTNSRYFASSDYLLTQWAEPAEMSAETWFAQARNNWISQRNSKIQDALSADDQQRRLEALGEQYGEPIISACGLTVVDGQAVDGITAVKLLSSGRITSGTCYLGQTCPLPTRSGIGHFTGWDFNSVLNDLAKEVDTQTVQYTSCVAQGVLAASMQPLDDFQSCLATEGSVLTGDGSQNPPLIHCVKPGAQTESIVDMTQYGNEINVQTWSGWIMGGSSRQHDVETACRAKYGFHPPPTLQIPPGCMNGSLGEAVMNALSAKASVESALAGLQTARVQASDQANKCLQLMQDEGTKAVFRARMLADEYNIAQAQESAAMAQEIDGGWSLDPVADLSKLTNIITDGALDTGPTVIAEKQFWATVDTNAYTDIVDAVGDQEMVNECWREFHTDEASTNTALETVSEKLAAFNAQQTTIASLKDSITRQALSGQAAIDRERNRKSGGYAFHYWLNETVDRFRSEMEWARRVTYLAMRAVESEFQESLSLRTDILSATHPDQLAAVIRVLQQESASRSINRRRPEESSVVLSVRDDVLRIADRSSVGGGERNWNPAQRFEGRLRSPIYTVRDQSGNVMGQGVPFALDPHGMPAANTVQLDSRCGERLWRVTATIQGDGLSPDEPGAPILLLKRNTFESQWCADHGDGSVMQAESIQPARQLFNPKDQSIPVDQSTEFTAASIYPWYNIRKTDFYKTTYQDGDSEELAGRGLYGDYIVLFPQKLLDAGFPIEKVEDVLLRFDYLSVDNLPQVAN